MTRVDDGPSEADYGRDHRECICTVEDSRDHAVAFVRGRCIV